MVKYFTVLAMVTNLYSSTIFETNCKKCHTQEELTLFMKEYTLKFSSKDRIKNYLYKFLENPTSNIPVMPYNFIIKKGYKTDTTLTSKELKEAIDTYYNEYNIQKNIR